MPKFKPQLPKPSKQQKLPKPSKHQHTNSTPKPSGWRRVLRIALVLVALGSVFVIFAQLSPSKKTLTTNQQEVFTAAVSKKPDVNTLIIPKIAVSSPILDGDAAVLDKGTWHRFPDRGNPEKGGNFILAAHRYVFALLPQQVSKQSVLYNIDKLELGDDIFIDWQGKRYSYKVSQKRTVKPNETSIELASKTPKLTLYSCTTGGDRDGREVIVATPQG